MRPLPCLIALAAAGAGCTSWVDRMLASEGAVVRVEALGERPATIDATLPYGSYSSTEADESMYASDLPLDTLLSGDVRDAQFLHVQLLWSPKPGNTPVDPTATNVTLRYVLLVDGEIGIYGGAGFAWPSGKVGTESLLLSIEGSSLSLLACTAGFADPLTPAQLTGTVMMAPNADSTRMYRRAISQIATDALGASRWVDRSRQAIDPATAVALVFPAETRDSRGGT